MYHAHAFVAADHPPHRRSLLFGRTMAKEFSMGLAIAPCTPAPLDATVRGFDHPRLGLAKVRFSPHRTRSAHVGRHDTRLLITIVRQGSALVYQDGRECRLFPGDMALIDPSRAFSAETDDIVAHSLYLPRSSVRGLMPAIDAVTACAIGTTSGAGAIFRAFLDQLIATAPMLDDAAIDPIADAIPLLLAAALAGTAAAREGYVIASQNQLAHLHRIWSFVNDNLGDPRLGPASVAAAVNLSPRYIDQLLTTQGQSLMRAILARRLERCRAELTDPRLKNRKISDIAFDWGFRNMPHFCRAFRRQFGHTAAACRSGALPATPACRHRATGADAPLR